MPAAWVLATSCWPGQVLERLGGVSGVRVWGLGVWGFGFRVWEFGVQGFGVRTLKRQASEKNPQTLRKADRGLNPKL